MLLAAGMPLEWRTQKFLGEEFLLLRGIQRMWTFFPLKGD